MNNRQHQNMSEEEQVEFALQLSSLQAELAQLEVVEAANKNNAQQHRDSGDANVIEEVQTRNSLAIENNYKPPVAPLFYDYYLRQQCFYYGFTSIIDFLFIPVLAPLILTWYRIKPVWTKLAGGSLWGPNEYALVISQFVLLVLDSIILLPIGLILFVTQVRWGVIQKILSEPIKKDELWGSFDESLYLYGRLVRQLTLLFFDIVLFVPLGTQSFSIFVFNI